MFMLIKIEATWSIFCPVVCTEAEIVTVLHYLLDFISTYVDRVIHKKSEKADFFFHINKSDNWKRGISILSLASGKFIICVNLLFWVYSKCFLSWDHAEIMWLACRHAPKHSCRNWAWGRKKRLWPWACVCFQYNWVPLWILPDRFQVQLLFLKWCKSCVQAHAQVLIHSQGFAALKSPWKRFYFPAS